MNSNRTDGFAEKPLSAKEAASKELASAKMAAASYNAVRSRKVSKSCGPWELSMRFGSDNTQDYDASPPALRWKAHLYINTWHLPRLMTEGFRLTEANVRYAESYIKFPTQTGAPYLRTYPICDTGFPRWRGTLEVRAWDMKSLSDFRIRNLTVDDILQCYAYDVHKRLVYNFTRLRADESFNAYYDDMPMEGWWPWPLREDSRRGREATERGRHRDSLKKWLGSRAEDKR